MASIWCSLGSSSGNSYAMVVEAEKCRLKLKTKAQRCLQYLNSPQADCRESLQHNNITIILRIMVASYELGVSLVL